MMDSPVMIYVGLGIGMSVLGFFLKRVKGEVDKQVVNCRRTELAIARLEERFKIVEKVLEDRRKDVQDLYGKLSK